MTQHTHTIQKLACKGKSVSLNQLSVALGHLIELLQQKPGSTSPALPIRKLRVKLRVLKRLSPFLLTALFLPVLIIYWLVVGSVNRWLLCFLFVATEINLFYIDVVLWKYFEGKKIFVIWSIEMLLVIITVYFLPCPVKNHLHFK